VETENFNYIRKILERDFNTFSGLFLEKLFQELIADTHEYNRIGNYREKGNSNEIDIVAVNDFEKKLLIAEVKINPVKINLEEIKRKSRRLIKDYKDYRIKCMGLSLKDIDKYL